MDKRPSLVTQEIQSLRILASKCMLIFLIYSHSHLPKATHLLNSNIFFHAAVGSQDAHIWLASWHNTCASATLDVLYYWLISLLGWVCFAHFHFPLWTCCGASFHQLVQRACSPKRTQQRNVRVLCTLKLLWQGPETKTVLAAVLANPKPTHPTSLSCLPVPHAMDTCVLPAWVTAEYHRLSFPTSEHSVLNFLQRGNKKVSEREAWVQTVCCSKVCVVALLCLGARYLSL